MHVAEIPGHNFMSRPSHQPIKYLKTGPKPRRPAGLAAGPDRPRWLRGLERFCGRAAGGAWPEQNRRWMERERGRRVRRKLPSTPQTNKRKPGQAPAGPASAGPAGRTRARAKAGGESWLATGCLFKNSGAATQSRAVSTTNSNSIRSIKTAHCGGRAPHSEPSSWA